MPGAVALIVSASSNRRDASSTAVKAAALITASGFPEKEKLQASQGRKSRLRVKFERAAATQNHF